MARQLMTLLRRDPPPASGAIVMGTGIVSIALFLDGQSTLSTVLFLLSAVVWIALAVLVPARALLAPARFAADVRTPAALTAVAGTLVLGTRLVLAGSNPAGIAALVASALAWAALLGPVLADLPSPTDGGSLLLAVSTEALAALAGALAAREHIAWLLYVALVPLGLGLALYGWVIARFDPRELLEGAGEHWITGGALAISTLAAGDLTSSAHALGILGSGGGVLRYLTIVLWYLTLAWLPALVICELLRPRLRYDLGRWATVFPLGMYAACSLVAGAATRTRAMTDFAHVWVWVALAVWTVVAAGTLRRINMGADFR